MKKRKNTNYRSITTAVIVVIAVIAAILVANSSFFNNDASGKSNDIFYQQTDTMRVSFIDVGQGNCTFITCGNKAILVDSGEVGAAQTVINYIKNQGVEKIDCVVVTHPHSDHMGAMTKILYEFKIGDFIMPEIPNNIIPTNKTYEKFLTAVSDNAENVIAAVSGSTYFYGEMKIEFFAPLHDYDNLNDMSAVSRISYGKTSVMFTGDASTDVENDLLNKNIDYSATILNIGHHGSKTSSSEEWLEAVDPSFAVICCGKNNDYGHPNNTVIKRLEDFGIEYFRTDLLGTIVFESDSVNFKKCD